MRIRGTSVPECRLCSNYVRLPSGCRACRLELDFSKCKKFTYDVLKYEPKTPDLKKFSKEDFEI